jgi:catechol 2,3-dioxygenase-like lactoylglutathione lyase family enzyme
MLRKIDCLMIRVEDIEVSATYYAKVFGLRPKWSGEGAIGLVFPDTDAEIVLHRETTFPSSVEAYYSVDDVIVAVAHYVAQGCQNTGGPFRHHNWEMRGYQRSIWYETLYP